MAMQLSADIWTQYQGEEVAGLLIRRRRLDYRKRISDHWVKIDTPIECVSISDEYMAEFAVKVHFAEALVVAADVNDSMLMSMVAGWECAGRFIRSEGRILVMSCPAVLGNGIPPAQVRFDPVAPRQVGLPEKRYGWQR